MEINIEEAKKLIGERAFELYNSQQYYPYAQHIKSILKRKLASKDFESFVKIYKISTKQLISAKQASFIIFINLYSLN